MHPHRHSIASFSVLLLLILPGCVEVDSCTEYVDYMCDCHASEVDCEELRSTWSSSSLEDQDACSLELDDQLAQDADDGLVCEDDGDTDGTI